MSNTDNLIMNNLPLNKLISEALLQLEELGYSARMVRRYKTVWKRLILFAKQHAFNNEFSNDLSKQFLGQYGIQQGQSLSSKEAWRKHSLFTIKMLDNFARYSRLERDRIDIKKLNVPPAMKKILREYEHYCRDKRHLRNSSIQERIREINVFLDFLGTRKVNTFNQIQAIDLSEFVTLMNRLKAYAIHLEDRTPEAFFFPSPTQGPWSQQATYALFRKLLYQCGIAHGGRGKGPRVHDLRHTFAVHKLIHWYQEGADLNVKLPLLVTYLGHQNFSGTQKYLHLTAELFPELTSRMNSEFGEVIPRRVQK